MGATLLDIYTHRSSQNSMLRQPQQKGEPCKITMRVITKKSENLKSKKSLKSFKSKLQTKIKKGGCFFSFFKLRKIHKSLFHANSNKKSKVKEESEVIEHLQPRAATAGKAGKVWSLPRFWVSVRSYKKQPVKKFWGRILDLAWYKFAVAHTGIF